MSLWPPAIRLPSWDGWGHSFGPFVFLPNGGSERLLRHELWHVRQDYATFGLAPFLALLSKRFRYAREVAAYGESVRAGGDAKHYAKVLAGKHYAVGRTEAECWHAIAEAAERGKLFG